jgi:hypothetical protein
MEETSDAWRNPGQENMAAMREQKNNGEKGRISDYIP